MLSTLLRGWALLCECNEVRLSYWAGRSPGWPERETPSTSPRATTRRPGGRAAQGRAAGSVEGCPGPARGRAAHCRRDAARARCGLAEQTRSEPPASDRQALRRMSTNMQLGRHSMAPLVSSREHASAFGTKGSPSPGGHCLRLGEWRWTGSFVSRSSGPPPAAVNSGNRRSTSTQLSERVGSIGAGRGIGRIRSASTCSGYGSDALAGRLPGETALARSGQDRTQPCSSPVARRGSPRRRGWDVQPRWVGGRVAVAL